MTVALNHKGIKKKFRENDIKPFIVKCNGKRINYLSRKDD